jgi:uncharacterized RDD family membrane protein YckC
MNVEEGNRVIDEDNMVIENSNGALTTTHFAGLRKRLVAFGFDFLLIFAYVLILLGIGIGITITTGPLDQIHPIFASPVFMDLLAFLILVLPVILYFTLQESSWRQATWGKRKAGLQVVNTRGTRLTRKQAFVRSLLKFLPWQIAHTSIFHIEGLPFKPAEPTPLVISGLVLVWVLLGIYAISVLVSKKHRTPYDWVAGAYVVVIR